MSGTASTPSTTVPPGWYPDPSGAPSWRRWEGSAWTDATLPYRVATPDADQLHREAFAWRRLRPLMPISIAAPAVGAALLASESPSYAPLRTWLHAAWRAAQLGQPRPPVPTNQMGTNSALATALELAVLVLVGLGVLGWLRYSAASLHTAAAAGYGRGHSPVVTGLAFFVPIAGPLVAASTSRSCLPGGHEARGVLTFGWVLVALAETAWLSLYATVLITSSQAVTWAVAAGCAAVWLGAALVLPDGLRAVAEDHATLDVRPSAAYS